MTEETMHGTQFRLDRAWRSDRSGVRVSVARPKLPQLDELTPYLRRIDAARWYANGGPLVREFESRLEERTDAPPGGVVLVSNATTGLALALAALELPRGTLCMVPSWTFSATAHAVTAAGLVPWLVDVDDATWSLTPTAARILLREAPGKVSAILPVAPFGRPLDVEAWEWLRASNDCAVLIDAAAGFDKTAASSVPIVVSLHATKTLAVGEGAFVVSRDPLFVRSVRQRANFGILGDRQARVEATNGKLSEYAAAVGLASLDSWDRTRAGFQRVATAYRTGLRGSAAELQPGYGLTWIASTTNVVLPPERIEPLEDALDDAGYGSRRWWGSGLVAQNAFRECPRTSTPVTDRLSSTVLGLPCWSDLPNETVAHVAAIVREVCA